MIADVICQGRGTLFGDLGVFEWGWLSIFVAVGLIALFAGGIILIVVWLTGGLSGRN